MQATESNVFVIIFGFSCLHALNVIVVGVIGANETILAIILFTLFRADIRLDLLSAGFSFIARLPSPALLLIGTGLLCQAASRFRSLRIPSISDCLTTAAVDELVVHVMATCTTNCTICRLSFLVERIISGLGHLLSLAMVLVLHLLPFSASVSWIVLGGDCRALISAGWCLLLDLLTVLVELLDVGQFHLHDAFNSSVCAS